MPECGPEFGLNHFLYALNVRLAGGLRAKTLLCNSKALSRKEVNRN